MQPLTDTVAFDASRHRQCPGSSANRLGRHSKTVPHRESRCTQHVSPAFSIIASPATLVSAFAHTRRSPSCLRRASMICIWSSPRNDSSRLLKFPAISCHILLNGSEELAPLVESKLAGSTSRLYSCQTTYFSASTLDIDHRLQQDPMQLSLSLDWSRQARQ